MQCAGKTAKGVRCERSAGPAGYCSAHDSLTDKQRAFVVEYLVDLNATAAAKRAGYSPESARVIGPENLTKPDIRAAVDAHLEERAMGAGEALARLADMARASIGDFVVIRDGKAVIDLSQADRLPMHLIRRLKITEQRYSDTVESVKTELELHDPKDALVQLLKISGAYTDKIDITTGGEKLTWRDRVDDVKDAREAVKVFAEGVQGDE